jgi:hypothetical protein
VFISPGSRIGTTSFDDFVLRKMTMLTFNNLSSRLSLQLNVPSPPQESDRLAALERAEAAYAEKARL